MSYQIPPRGVLCVWVCFPRGTDWEQSRAERIL